MSEVKRSDPIGETDKFIAWLSKSPIWKFAWGILIAVVVFIGGVFWNLNEENANIEKFNSLSHSFEMDSRRTELLKRTMSLVWSALVEEAKYFSSKVEGSRNLASIPHDAVDEGFRLVRESRGGISAELSLLSSLNFEDSGLKPFVTGFQQDMEALNERLATKELIYRRLKEKKYAEAQKELKKWQDTSDYRKEGELNTALLRVQSFDNALELKKEHDTAERGLEEARLKSFERKVYLLFPAGGYVGLFFVMLMRKRKRSARARDANQPLEEREDPPANEARAVTLPQTHPEGTTPKDD